MMALDDIKKVTKAEEATQAAKETALANGRQEISQAQRDAQLLIEKSRADAGEQVRQMIAKAEEQAAGETKAVLEAAEQNCGTLRQSAQAKLDEAAKLITERVVNSQWQS